MRLIVGVFAVFTAQVAVADAITHRSPDQVLPSAIDRSPAFPHHLNKQKWHQASRPVISNAPYRDPGARSTLEPFGLATLRISAGGLSSKWGRVERDIQSESHILANCRADRDHCPSAAALRFLAIIDSARLRTGRARFGEINRAINLAIRPMSDLAQYGVADLWTSPLVTLTAGAGDCEDYAIAKYVALREAGVSEDDLRLLVVLDTKLREMHAVVAARLDGSWVVLDNRRLVMLHEVELKDYMPLFAIDHGSVKRFLVTGHQPGLDRRDASANSTRSEARPRPGNG